MCMVDYGDGWKVFRAEQRTARKEYRCYECNRVIEPGERYEFATGITNDGYDKWSVMHTCAHCQAGPCRWLNRVCGGYLYGGVYEDLDEHRFEPDVRDMALYRALIGMKRKWRKRDGTLMAVPA
jgi:hypothetical protein